MLLSKIWSKAVELMIKTGVLIPAEQDSCLGIRMEDVISKNERHHQ